MAADVGEFSAAIDKVYKAVSTQEMQVDPQEMRGLSGRSAMQNMERKFQQQLQRARAAFLQEFRNHSVVVESEVKKIREELAEKMEEKYVERINGLKAENLEAAGLIQKHKEEISQLKSLLGAQESYLAAVRHRFGLESKDKLRSEIAQLREDLDTAKQDSDDLSHQLMCRDELVVQLNKELGAMEGELKRQATVFSDTRRTHEDMVRGLRAEMQMQQEQFARHLKAYDDQFNEYKAKTTAELEIADILNQRRMEALVLMEKERKTHLKARSKPTARIGDTGAEPKVVYEEYVLGDARYRVDDLGMDTGWRDYKLSAEEPPQAAARPTPRFRIDRIRKSAQRANVRPVAPTVSEVPNETPRSLPGSAPSAGAAAALDA